MSNRIKGIIASPGIRIGKAYLYKTAETIIPKYLIKDREIESEIKRYRQSLEKTRDDIKAIQQQIAQSLSSDMADIFTSHLMVLEDPIVTEKAINKIRTEKRNVEWVINEITLELIKSLDTIQDDYLRERIVDISDINKRLINNLQKRQTSAIRDIKEEVILFSRDLTPSDT
ncbi:MAG: hypothetical protein KBA61_11950, partial [Spirochaetes bacterium]|nr:hypothetical protein [Spirochaetota bacterium]